MTGAAASELLDRDRSVVVVVDLQGRLLPAVDQAEALLEATARLLGIAGIFEVPVILTEQYPEGLGPTDPSIQAAFDALPGSKRKVAKTRFSCCGDQGFEAALDELSAGTGTERRQVVMAGVETHVCVMQTSLDLLRRGTAVHLCGECVSGRGRGFRRSAIERMQHAGAVLTNHESVGFEWARDKDHPRFRDLNRLLRAGQMAGVQDP